MKQTKKLTRRHKEFLSKKGYGEKLSRIRFIRENKNETVFYDTEKEENIVFQKVLVGGVAKCQVSSKV